MTQFISDEPLPEGDDGGKAIFGVIALAFMVIGTAVAMFTEHSKEGLNTYTKDVATCSRVDRYEMHEGSAISQWDCGAHGRAYLREKPKVNPANTMRLILPKETLDAAP